MIRNATATLAFAALLTAGADPARAGPHEARIARIERTLLPAATIVGTPTRFMSLDERMAHFRVPAVSVAVIDGNRIAWSRAWGRTAADGAPATPRTLFQAASISKPVFASAALRLVHRGRIGLDAPVNAGLRSWRLPDGEAGQAEAVTLRRLLSHSAGLSVHGFRGYAAGEPVPALRQLLDGAEPANSDPVRIAQAPGAAWRYSGGGTSLAQLLVEDASGSALAPLMRRLVLVPLGMRDSGFDQPLPAARRRQAAIGHRPDGEAVAGGWHTYPEQAAAGLWTTPTDLARFALWVMAGANGGGDAEQRFVAQQLITPQPGLDAGGGSRMGLGLFLDGEGEAMRFSHGGSNEGYRAFLVGFPGTGQGAVIMTNGDAGARLARELVRAIALEYGWPDKYHQMLVPLRLSAESLGVHAGAYSWGEEEDDRVVFAVEEAALVARPAGVPPLRLVPVGPGSFFHPETGIRVRFEGDEAVIAPPSSAPRRARRAPAE